MAKKEVKVFKALSDETRLKIVEFLEDLNYIELAYKLAKDIQTSLPPESVRIEEIRKIVRRLHSTPITEQKDRR